MNSMRDNPRKPCSASRHTWEYARRVARPATPFRAADRGTLGASSSAARSLGAGPALQIGPSQFEP